jgi:hypothetical protein
MPTKDSHGISDTYRTDSGPISRFPGPNPTVGLAIGSRTIRSPVHHIRQRTSMGELGSAAVRSRTCLAPCWRSHQDATNRGHRRAVKGAAMVSMGRAMMLWSNPRTCGSSVSAGRRNGDPAPPFRIPPTEPGCVPSFAIGGRFSVHFSRPRIRPSLAGVLHADNLTLLGPQVATRTYSPLSTAAWGRGRPARPRGENL